MPSFFTDAVKDAMLGTLTPNLISLHDGNPGSDGTDNEIEDSPYSRQAAVFNAASGGVRVLDEPVAFSADPATEVTHAGVWNSSGPTFLGYAEIQGDTAFNSNGDFTLTTDTLIRLVDPS